MTSSQTSSARALPPLVSVLAGALFGLGLLCSGMVDPAKVLAFLDVLGRWDPRLAGVMAAAVAVAAPAFWWVARRGRALSGAPVELPPTRGLDARLVCGSLLFGAGWGLAGLCPGPALVAAALGSGGALLFVAAMLAGMGLHRLLQGRSGSSLRAVNAP